MSPGSSPDRGPQLGKGTSHGREALARELCREPPSGVLTALSDEQLAAVADAVRAARHRQAAALAIAGEKALGVLPRALRGPVRRMAGG